MVMQLAIYAPKDGSSIYVVTRRGCAIVHYDKERHYFTQYGTRVHFSHWFNSYAPELTLHYEDFMLKYSIFGAQ